MDVADYGTPQYRKRAIVLISKRTKKINWEIPKKERQISVRDVIEHLPSLESEEKNKEKQETIEEFIE